MAHLEVAGALERQLVGQHFACEGNTTGNEVAFHNLVNQWCALEPNSGRGVARYDDVQSGLQPQQARQALRAASTGQQAQFDLGEPKACIGQRHPEVATQRQFQATAQALTPNGGHHRLGIVFDQADDHAQVGFTR